MTSGRSAPAWALGVTSIAFFMVTLDALVVVTALPSIHRDLGGSLSLISWAVNAYTLAFAVGIVTAAAVGDRYGRRRVFATGLIVFALASAGCAMAPNIPALIAARAAQGIGAAIVMPLSLTILTGAFPAERRGLVVGLWGGIAGLGVASGPLVGGVLTQGLDWHWIFWVNVPIGLVAAILAMLRISQSVGPRSRFDVPAVALLSVGATGLVWALVRANELGWASAEVLIALGGGIASLVAFAAWERRAPEPMFPPRLFANTTFVAANATGFLMTAALFGAAFLGAQYFQIARGLSPFDTGLQLLPWTATPIVIAPLAGALSDRIGRRPLMVTGLILQAAGLALLASLSQTTVDYALLVAPLIIAGVGVSMVLPTAPTAVLSAVRPADIGKASGINSTLQRLGSAFGVAVVTAVLSANGGAGSTAAVFAGGFGPAMGVAALLSLIGAGAALFVAPRTQPTAVAAGALGSEV